MLPGDYVNVLCIYVRKKGEILSRTKLTDFFCKRGGIFFVFS